MIEITTIFKTHLLSIMAIYFSIFKLLTGNPRFLFHKLYHQLTNHCQIPLELSYKKLDLQSLLGASIPGEEQNEFTSIGVVQPQETMDIPLLVAYHAGIYACPLDRG